ncbi:MAG: hypothetical protein SGILL_009750, partial [Bacillariaceae sp.]
AVDDLLSQELQSLSFQDRSAIQEEIHGVRTSSPTETPEMIQLSLLALQIAIQESPCKRGYDLAETLSMKLQQQQQQQQQEGGNNNNSYVNDPEFRLRFLRCELFDVKKAATRMCNYLDLVLDKKGETALQQHQHLPRLQDLSPQELDYLKQGYIQLLPYRDRSGRRIIVLVDNFGLQTDYGIRVSKAMKKKEGLDVMSCL